MIRRWLACRRLARLVEQRRNSFEIAAIASAVLPPSSTNPSERRAVAGSTQLSEAQIQLQIRHYLAALGIDAVHVPNGSVLAGDAVARAKQSNALKRAGVLPGFADLILLDRRFSRRVGFIEVKAAKGRLSPQQEAFADLCEKVWQLPYAVARSVEDTAQTLNTWGWR